MFEVIDFEDYILSMGVFLNVWFVFMNLFVRLEFFCEILNVMLFWSVDFSSVKLLEVIVICEICK